MQRVCPRLGTDSCIISMVAPSYSPAFDSSTIGSTGLNGSVRNGRGVHPPYLHQPIDSSALLPECCSHRPARQYLFVCEPTERNKQSHYSTKHQSPATQQYNHTRPGPLVRLSLTALTAYTCRLSTWSSTTPLSFGRLIFRPVSHLDAFSAYPIPT